MLEVDPCPVPEGSYAACLRAVAHRLIMPSCLERGGLTVLAGDRPRFLANPSRMPGKRSGSIGCRANNPIRTQDETPLRSKSGS